MDYRHEKILTFYENYIKKNVASLWEEIKEEKTCRAGVGERSDIKRRRHGARKEEKRNKQGTQKEKDRFWREAFFFKGKNKPSFS